MVLEKGGLNMKDVDYNHLKLVYKQVSEVGYLGACKSKDKTEHVQTHTHKHTQRGILRKRI